MDFRFQTVLVSERNLHRHQGTPTFLMVLGLPHLYQQFDVVAEGHFDSLGFCLQTHFCLLCSFCISFTLTDLHEEVLQGIKCCGAFPHTVPWELRLRCDLEENSRDTDISDISPIQWSRCIKNMQRWRYVEIWLWKSKLMQHKPSCTSTWVLYSKKSSTSLWDVSYCSVLGVEILSVILSKMFISCWQWQWTSFFFHRNLQKTTN